jgi:putative inorganic carbon (hco3(-)) transporter
LLTSKQHFAFYAIMLAYISINCILFIFDMMWLSLLPAVIFMAWLIIYYPSRVLLFIAFATPLSIKTTFESVGLSINLPTEPLLIVMMGFFWLKVFLDADYDIKVIRQPITLVIIFNLFWILVTACTSSMPLVSIKFFIARFWFVTCFYFLAVLVFRDYKNIRAFFWLFSASLVLVVVYALQRHASYLFEQSYSTKAPQPFFPDHGVYAAVVSLMVPAALLFFTRRKAFGLSLWQQFFALVISLILITGIIFSFTRAAWIGLGAASGFFVILLLRIRFYQLLTIAALIIGVLSFYQTDIYLKLRSNKKVSTSDLEQHVKSIYNISTDASNTERINRWHSAIRMFRERPVFGWGPNTYMFQYSPFQLSSERTIISVRTGSQGNAHSEYIGPLAEEGVLGLLSVVSIFFVSLYKGMQLTYNGRTARIRYTAMAAMLGLITYFVHGFINNYLDQDKAAVPVFALLAIITALDIYHQRNEQSGIDVV